MIFNLFNKKKIISELREQGGMNVKYSQLISHIKKLAQTFEQKFETKTEKINEYTIGVVIDFSGQKDFALAYIDAFILQETKKGLKIFWRRHSENITRIPVSILPNKIEHSFLFKNIENQKSVFNDLLNKVQNTLKSKYNFSDTHYQNVLENGFATFLSKEEEMKLDMEMTDWLIKQQEKK